MVQGVWKFEYLSSIIFQKSDIGWPQKPPKEKVLKFNVFLHDSTKKIAFSKQQCKTEFKNSDGSEVFSYLVAIFQASMHS